MATFSWLLVLSAALVAAAWTFARRLAPSAPGRPDGRWLISWSLRGLAVPLAVWALMNLGISWELQPYMPQVQMAQNSGGGWAPEFMSVLGIGLFIIASFWAALTLGWVLVKAGARLDDEPRMDFKALCFTCFVAMIVPALIILLLGGWPLLGLAACAILLPTAAWARNMASPRKVPPIYAGAIARMKFGKYSEAEWEIIRELEKCEDDFEGWMMLAELYANHFQDLTEAEHTIQGICEQPGVTPSQLTVALHKLADWRLKLGGDPAGARQALQQLCDRLPGTHLARMARLRMNQLPATSAELRQQQTARAIPLPALGEALDEAPAAELSASERAEAVAAANACIATLNQNPNNIPAREQFARLLADRLNQPDQAIEQMNLLLKMSGQPDFHRAEWLGLIAAWHLKYRRDFASARAILERIVSEFPATPQALFARRRLELLEK